MHGVIFSRHQDLRIVDLSHGISPQAIPEAAFWLAASYREFPEGSVHVVVVDPGVGTQRDVLLADIDNHYFIVPDNGVLDIVRTEAERVEIRKLNVQRLYLNRVSHTFHGRDVFAPAAAEIASGKVWLSELGTLTENYQTLSLNPARREGEVIKGEVITADHFGNLISNVPTALLKGRSDWNVHFGDQVLPLRKTYAEVEIGKPLALINAFERVEIAIREGRAESYFNCGPGQPLEINTRTI